MGRRLTAVEWRWQDLPRWVWLTLAALTALILLPIYLRWFGWAMGACAFESLLPRVA